ncbi:hypothetical protein ST47_g5357 [Ascochyta rabiei]|uniref:Uncharacterized protein n=1 Tax=Didymella rabiei TaxID=5454 RepID=A0A163E3L2_DIDRA|nr:hypothetical protein ST47_g5357 [Ascochyta rabiei]
MSKIFLIGATGYVGGTVLSQSLASTETSLKTLTVDILIRREHQAGRLRETYGERVETVLWAGLDDTVPCFFGEGTGLFNRQALVIPLVLRYVVQHGYGFKLNDQANFDWVYVVDLADYYIPLIRKILERPDRGVGHIPLGKKGILFPTVGRALVAEINQQAVETAFDADILLCEDTTQQREVRCVPIQEIADELIVGRCDIAPRG